MIELTIKQKTSIALLVTLIAGGVFIFTLVSALVAPVNSEDLEMEATVVTTQPLVGPNELPERLVIPSLSLDAYVQHVGVTKNNAMAIPTNFKDVAWYKLGAVPGQPGNAVINGHLDNGLALAAVFKELHTLVPGDSVYVVTEGGTRLQFVVEALQYYPYDEVPMEEIVQNLDIARLTLITCSGSWLKNLKTYDERLVVYTRYVGNEEVVSP